MSGGPHDDDVREYAISLYHQQMGSKAAARAVQRELDIKVSHTTVQRWWRERRLPARPGLVPSDEAVRQLTLDLYAKCGNALQVQRGLADQGVEVSHRSIIRWAAAAGLPIRHRGHTREVKVAAVALWLRGHTYIGVSRALAREGVTVKDDTVSELCREDTLIRSAVGLMAEGMSAVEILDALNRRGYAASESLIHREHAQWLTGAAAEASPLPRIRE